LNSEVSRRTPELDSKVSTVEEQILYDSREGMDGFHFDGRGASIKDGPVGKGKHKILDRQVLNIDRTNQEGRYEVRLTQYHYRHSIAPHVPRDLTVAGQRKVMIRYLAKAHGGKHQIRTVLKSTDETGQWLASKDDYIDQGSKWEEVECFFHIDPSRDFYVRLDDLGISAVPSSVQIRDIVVKEKTI
jgi:hypothetical protein